MTPRELVCYKLCRLRCLIDNEPSIGNCPCDKPNECRFELADKQDVFEEDLLFPDVKKFYRELASE